MARLPTAQGYQSALTRSSGLSRVRRRRRRNTCRKLWDDRHMESTLQELQPSRSTSPWSSLPPSMRTLFIAGCHRTGAWLAEAFAADSASQVFLEESVGMVAGLARLRDEVFDAVLISHEPGELDALELLDALRAGNGDEQPIVVLGELSFEEMSALCYEGGADAYVCVNTTTTRALIWQVARAMDRHRLVAENRRLVHEQRHRLQMEHEEATRLLDEQRGLIGEWQSTGDLSHDEPAQAVAAATHENPLARSLPDPLVGHYQELLRAYVIMGSGNLTNEIQRLAGMFSSAGMSAQRVMLLHLQVLDDVVRSLGNRSARHVINRADLLILEVMMLVCDGYRGRYFQRLYPPRQRMLPGFDNRPL